MYTDLLTNYHKQRPRFSAWVAALTQHSLDLQTFIAAAHTAFSIDTAVGVQLDAIGAWIGLSRRVKIPSADNYFSWDTEGLGWDEGSWKGPFVAATTEVNLSDDLYRAALRLQILCNNYGGTLGEVSVFSVALGTSGANTFHVVDNQNMTISVTVTGPTVPSTLRAVILQKGLVPRPMGVHLASITYV